VFFLAKKKKRKKKEETDAKRLPLLGVFVCKEMKRRNDLFVSSFSCLFLSFSRHF
jgi:hypothetical protein